MSFPSIMLHKKEFILNFQSFSRGLTVHVHNSAKVEVGDEHNCGQNYLTSDHFSLVPSLDVYSQFHHTQRQVEV
jgi:hypothetical protein